MASRFRRANPDDAPAIAGVYVETWRTTYAGSVPDKVLLEMSPEIQAVRWTRAIEKKGPEIIVVAEDRNGGVIGVGSCGPNRQRRSSFAGEVYTLYVHPDFQEQGNGRGLLLRLFEELMGAGHNSAVSGCWPPTPAATSTKPWAAGARASGSSACGAPTSRRPATAGPT